MIKKDFGTLQQNKNPRKIWKNLQTVAEFKKNHEALQQKKISREIKKNQDSRCSVACTMGIQ